MTNSNERAVKLLKQDSKEDVNIPDMIGRAMDESLSRIIPLIAEGRVKDPLSDYIPKSEVRGKILSSSTLWKLEQKGNLKTYAISGKRYYKRSEIENLIQQVKK